LKILNTLYLSSASLFYYLQHFNLLDLKTISNLSIVAPHYLTSDKNVSSEWPEKGSIKFSNVTMRYRQGLPRKSLNVYAIFIACFIL